MLLIAALTPLMLMALLGSYTAFTSQRERLEARALADARLLSAAVDRELAGMLDQAEGLAASPALDGPGDLAGFHEVIRREQTRHPSWMNVLLLDPQGKRLAAALDTPLRRA